MRPGRRRSRWLAALVLGLIALASVPRPVIAGPEGTEDSLAPYRVERGPFELGLGVSRLRLSGADPLTGSQAPLAGVRRESDPDLRTFDPRSAAISFDLKLRWPSLGTAADVPLFAGLQPYLSLGPALLVAEPDYSLLLRRDGQADYSMSLGVRGGAGLSWQVDRNVSLFGEYGFTRATEDRRVPGMRTPGDSLDTQGFRYGLKIQF